MNLQKVKDALDATEAAMMLGGIEPRDCEVFENGLGAIEYLRSFIAELEKPAEDGMPCLDHNCKFFDRSFALNCGGESHNEPAITHCSSYAEKLKDIDQYAESYPAKKCAECWRVPRVMCSICGDPIIIGGVCENCVPDMFNDDNTPKTGCTK